MVENHEHIHFIGALCVADWLLSMLCGVINVERVEGFIIELSSSTSAI